MNPEERAHSVLQIQRRLAILRSIIIGLDNAQAVSAALMASNDRATALVALQDLLGVDDKGAHVIAELQWGRLTKDTRPSIQQEIDELEAALRGIGD